MSKCDSIAMGQRISNGRSPKPSSRTTINCPARPEDYLRFKVGCQLIGISYHEAFREASELWLAQRCPAALALTAKEGR